MIIWKQKYWRRFAEEPMTHFWKVDIPVNNSILDEMWILYNQIKENSIDWYLWPLDDG